MMHRYECQTHGHDSEDEQCPDCEPEEAKAFVTWKFDGVQFLAFPHGRDFAILDEQGRNYGSWMDVARFRKRQQTQPREDWIPLGKASLALFNHQGM